MTMEKLQFALPAVFTIGPDNEPESLLKYAKLLSGAPDGEGRGATRKNAILPAESTHVRDIVKGTLNFRLSQISSGILTTG